MAHFKIYSRFRRRYVAALVAVALLSTGTWYSVRANIEEQGHFAKLIHLAGQQIGLSGRIVLFATQMTIADNPEDFNVAKAQLGRALSQIEIAHRVLLNGDPDQAIPYVMTPDLKQIYFAPSMNLDENLSIFINRGRTVYGAQQSELNQNTSAYIFLHQYGPYVMVSLLSAATKEYERASQLATKQSVYLSTVLWGALIFLLVVEAIFIFYPLELYLRHTLRRLKDRNKKLKTANRSKSKFLANMSHELRTPLNAIIGFSSVLMMETFGEFSSHKQREYVQDIHQSGEHLLEMINDILDMSGLEAGKLNLEEDEISLSAAVDFSWRMLHVRATEKNIGFCQNVSTDLAKLRADQRRIRQILLNLLTNSVKFTPSGGRITVNAWMSEIGEISLSVIDTGIGMDEQDVVVAMAPFGHVESVLSRTEGGAGLGLPLTRGLVELHGGTMDIESEKGLGTQITVIFPHHRTVSVSAQVRVSQG